MSLALHPDNTPTWQDKVTIYDKGLIFHEPLTLDETVDAAKTWVSANEVSRWAVAQLVQKLAHEHRISDDDIKALTGIGVGTQANYLTLLKRFPQNAEDPENLPLSFSHYMALTKRSDDEVETILEWVERCKKKDIHDKYPSITKMKYYIAIELDKESPKSWEMVSDQRSPDGQHRFVTYELKEVNVK